MIENLDVQQIYIWASAVIIGAKAFSAATPTQIDDKYVGRAEKYVNMVLRIVNIVGLNVGKARNADDPKVKKNES